MSRVARPGVVTCTSTLPVPAGDTAVNCVSVATWNWVAATPPKLI
jgi:hypothetical protein